MCRTSTWHWEDVKKNSGQTAAPVFVVMCLMPENRRLFGWMTYFFLMIMQSTELGSGSQGFLENPADCPKYLVVHVEREMSFWKSTLSEVSKGGVGCHQKYYHISIKNDPVFLELFLNGQWTEA